MAVAARVLDDPGGLAAPATLSADAWQRFRRSRLAMVGLVVVALLVIAAAGAPWLAPADPAKQSLIEKRARPGGKFILGADALGPGVLNTTIAVGIWGAPTATRLVRAAVLLARDSEYARAARALGASAGRVLTRHVLRNVLPTVIVYSTLFMANAILVEAALS